jgi:predicted metal-dependent hydrolase
LNVSGIGDVRFEPSRRAQRLNVTVTAFRGIRVAVPYQVTLKQALRFVNSKKGWILKHSAKVRQQEAVVDYSPSICLGMSEQEAKTKLKDRLAELASLYGFSYNRVAIRRQRTRWGSCSARNNISLNLRILQLPLILQDYVLLHELVHTRIKNHSPAFWRELDLLVGNAKGLRSRLRRYPL